MFNKRELLSNLMSDVARCDLCCEPHESIASDKLLRNLIAERPSEYGNIPHLFTDWVNRVESKIFVIGQDWGPDEEVLYIRDYYENRTNNWAFLVRNRPDGPSRSDSNIAEFFKESAKKEGLKLPRYFMDNIYFTNAVLCFQRARKGDSGTKHIDLGRSISNCCHVRKFLHRQVEIVNPTVVITLGKWALGGLRWDLLNQPLTRVIEDLQDGQEGRPMSFRTKNKSYTVVPVFHPAARPVNRNYDLQVADYRYIWKAIRVALNAYGTTDDLIGHMFPDRAV